MAILGPTIEGIIYAAPEMIKAYAAGATTRIGSSKGGSYDANRLNNVRSNEGVTRLGAVTAVYDPEWTAWLAGEI